MPKRCSSPIDQMNRAFLRGLAVGQALRGEKNMDTVRYVTVAASAFYRKLKDPGSFSVRDARILARRYFNDRQLCEAFGVEYHGATAEDGDTRR